MVIKNDGREEDLVLGLAHGCMMAEGYENFNRQDLPVSEPILPRRERTNVDGLIQILAPRCLFSETF